MKPALRERQTIKEALHEYYMDPSVNILTDTQKAILERWEFIADLLRNGRTQGATARYVMTTYNISRQQAYNDIRDCQEFFGAHDHTDKEFLRDVLWNLNLKVYKEARKKGDLRAATSALNNMMNVRGLAKEDKDLTAMESWTGPKFLMVLQMEDGQAIDIDLSQPHKIPAALRDKLLASKAATTMTIDQQLNYIDNAQIEEINPEDE